MPKFLDVHPTNADMPPEVVEGIIQKLKAGQPDENGTVALNVFVANNVTTCYAEAPNAEAVHKSHEAMGLKLGPGDVKEVQALV